jgi:hypothetical protein
VPVEVFSDYAGREFRLIDERAEHIERPPEMVGQRGRIDTTLTDPDEVRGSDQDDSVRLYYRHYSETPVTEKYLLVVGKVAVPSPFGITSFFTDRNRSARPVDSQ